MTATVSDIVSIRIEPQINSVSSTNFALSNILGTSNRLYPYDRVVEFSNLNEVGEIFCVTDPEYQAAAIYFAQSPTPQSLLISRQFTGSEPWDLVFTSVTLNSATWVGYHRIALQTDNLIVSSNVTSVTRSSITRCVSYSGVLVGTSPILNDKLLQCTFVNGTPSVTTIFDGSATQLHFNDCSDLRQNGSTSSFTLLANGYDAFNSGFIALTLVYDAGNFSLSGNTDVIPVNNLQYDIGRLDPFYSTTSIVWGAGLNSDNPRVIKYYRGSTLTALASTTGAIIATYAKTQDAIAFNKSGDTLYHIYAPYGQVNTILRKRNITSDSANSIDMPISINSIYAIKELFIDTCEYLLILAGSTLYSIDITGDSYSVTRTLEQYDLSAAPSVANIGSLFLGIRGYFIDIATHNIVNEVYEVLSRNIEDILTLDFFIATSDLSSYDKLAEAINSQVSGVNVNVDNLEEFNTAIGFAYAGYTGLKYIPYVSGNSSTTSSFTQIALGGTSNTAPPNITMYTEDETPSQAMNVISDIRNDWYAFTYVVTDKGDSITQSANLELAAWANAQEGTNNPHLFLFNTMDSNVINPSVTTDIFSKNKAANNKKSAGVYDPNNKFAAVPIMAMLSTIDWNASTVPTFAYKKAFNITPNSVLTQSQLNTLLAKFGGAYVQYGHLFSGYTKTFKTGSGDYVDVVVAIDVLTVLLRISIASQLASASKLPYNNAGASRLRDGIVTVLNAFVSNGFLGAGVWNGEPVGNLQTGQFVNDGYYVYIPSVETATQSQRSNRQYPPFQIALLGTGAIEQIVINGTFQN